MREIKFRAWNKSSEKLMNWDFIKSVGNLQKLLTLHHVEVMQFTGLTDILDNEIYDGDIVIDDSGRIWAIEWDSHCPGFVFVLQSEKKKFDGRIGSMRSRCQDYLMKKMELIGNKYQHPELLTPNN